ncbi:hypothetical protein CIT37_41575 [Bradyrhizobium ottawaense]|uniref:hypothetical protein n=1 Tax=Bradyrhizobium ottawaense TaxID=931866 RepID=UPI00157F9FEE|nr:hypothetical protein [Bradyrhizobium ottawaense]
MSKANVTSFKKGHVKSPNAGRPKGQPNKSTRMLREAILLAAEGHGHDGKGAGGLTGYLRLLAATEKATFARLLGRLMPLQVDVAEKNATYTVEEAAAELQRRGLPVPTLLALAPPPDEPPIPANEDAPEEGEFYERAPGVESIEQ